MENSCYHVEVVKINHWWFNYQCICCGNKYRREPKWCQSIWPLASRTVGDIETQTPINGE